MSLLIGLVVAIALLGFLLLTRLGAILFWSALLVLILAGWVGFVFLAEAARPGIAKTLEALPAAVSFGILGFFVIGMIWATWHERKCRQRS